MMILRVRCSLYGQCRFTVVAMLFKQQSFKFPMLCCDLYEEIKVAALFYIYIYIYIYEGFSNSFRTSFFLTLFIKNFKNKLHHFSI